VHNHWQAHNPYILAVICLAGGWGSPRAPCCWAWHFKPRLAVRSGYALRDPHANCAWLRRGQGAPPRCCACRSRRCGSAPCIRDAAVHPQHIASSPRPPHDSRTCQPCSLQAAAHRPIVHASCTHGVMLGVSTARPLGRGAMLVQRGSPYPPTCGVMWSGAKKTQS
jgi:hypothetical protein